MNKRVAILVRQVIKKYNKIIKIVVLILRSLPKILKI